MTAGNAISPALNRDVSVSWFLFFSFHVYGLFPRGFGVLETKLLCFPAAGSWSNLLWVGRSGAFCSDESSGDWGCGELGGRHVRQTGNISCPLPLGHFIFFSWGSTLGLWRRKFGFVSSFACLLMFASYFRCSVSPLSYGFELGLSLFEYFQFFCRLLGRRFF